MRGDSGVAGEFFPDIMSNDKMYNDPCWAYETKCSRRADIAIY